MYIPAILEKGVLALRKSTLKPKTRMAVIICLLPALIVYTYVVILPIINAFSYMLLQLVRGPQAKYVGWKNYQILLKDTSFWHAFSNNIWIAVLCIAGQIGIAFIFFGTADIPVCQILRNYTGWWRIFLLPYQQL